MLRLLNILIVSQCGYSAADVYLHAAPLFHIGGLCSALAMLAAGARHVFLPRFDGAALLAAVRRHRVTAFIAGGSRRAGLAGTWDGIAAAKPELVGPAARPDPAADQLPALPPPAPTTCSAGDGC